jgi:glutamate carboxypeptidase
MTYEPGLPDGGLVDARKGSAIFALILKGRSAHVGRAFDEGRNAVLAGAQAALALSALNGQRDGVTVNIGAIEGGGPVNVVPDIAVVRFNVRAPDEEAAAWSLAEVNKIVADMAALDGIAAALNGGFTRPPKPLTPAQKRLVDWTGNLARGLGQVVRFAPSGGVCEGNNLAAAGCPNIDTLGPCGGALHSEDEFAIAASFAPRAQLSFLMLAAFASGLHDVRELRS